jgi:hypothetical protein
MAAYGASAANQKALSVAPGALNALGASHVGRIDVRRARRRRARRRRSCHHAYARGLTGALAIVTSRLHTHYGCKEYPECSSVVRHFPNGSFVVPFVAPLIALVSVLVRMSRGRRRSPIHPMQRRLLHNLVVGQRRA